MKKITIADKAFEAVKAEASGNLTSDHWIGQDENGKPYVICSDNEMHFDNMGYVSVAYVPEIPEEVL